MDYLIVGILVFLYISLGIGVKELCKYGEHFAGGIPALILAWPVFLIMVAYFPSMTKKEE